MGTALWIESEAPVDGPWLEAALRGGVGDGYVVQEAMQYFRLEVDGLDVHLMGVDRAQRFDGRTTRVRTHLSVDAIDDTYLWRDVEVFALRLLARFATLEGASVLASGGIGIAASRGGGAAVVVREDIVGDLIDEPDLARSGVPYILGPVEWSLWSD